MYDHVKRALFSIQPTYTPYFIVLFPVHIWPWMCFDSLQTWCTWHLSLFSCIKSKPRVPVSVRAFPFPQHQHTLVRARPWLKRCPSCLRHLIQITTAVFGCLFDTLFGLVWRMAFTLQFVYEDLFYCDLLVHCVPHASQVQGHLWRQSRHIPGGVLVRWCCCICIVDYIWLLGFGGRIMLYGWGSSRYQLLTIIIGPLDILDLAWIGRYSSAIIHASTYRWGRDNHNSLLVCFGWIPCLVPRQLDLPIYQRRPCRLGRMGSWHCTNTPLQWFLLHLLYQVYWHLEKLGENENLIIIILLYFTEFSKDANSNCQSKCASNIQCYPSGYTDWAFFCW